MDKIISSRHAPQSWINAIDQSEAELAAGLLIDFDEVMQDFETEDTAAARPAAKAHHAKTPGPSTSR